MNWNIFFASLHLHNRSVMITRAVLKRSLDFFPYLPDLLDEFDESDKKVGLLKSSVEDID